MHKFKHSGRMGDIVWSLALIKQLGGADTLYLNINGPHGFTRIEYDFILPLLKKQPYINKVEIWNNEQVDYDLDIFRSVVQRPDYGSLCKTYFTGFNVDMDPKFQTEPWLYVDNIPNDKIIISKSSSTYNRNHNKFWDILAAMNSDLKNKAVFVGLKSECDVFNSEYGCDLPYYPVKDALELANLINGSYMLTGNQSLPTVIAEATKKTIFLESRLDGSKNDHIFTRANLIII